MQSLLHAPLLQALGYAIINSLWQFALLWLLYFLVNTAFKLTTHQKYTAGIVLEFAGFIWFVETLLFYYGQCLLLVQNHPVDHRLYFPAISATSGTLKQQFFLLVLRSEQFFPYLSVAYLTLLIVLTVRWFYAYSYTQQVRNKGLVSIDENWNSFVQNLSAQLGIKRTVKIFLSEVVQTPLTIGFFKPLILVPVATINYLTPQQLEAVLLHEIAHIKRFDYLFNLLLALIEAALFFNPFMQLLHHQVKKERENCCDDWVMKYEYNPTSYARALLEIASRQCAAPMLALNATDGKQVLITRIKRIIEKNERTFFNFKHQLLALLVMTIVLSSLSLLSPSKKRPVSASIPVQSNIIYEPMAAKVRNPLFNPVFFLATPAKSQTLTKKKEAEAKAGITTRIRVLAAPPLHSEAIEIADLAAIMPAAEPQPEAIFPSLPAAQAGRFRSGENFVTMFKSKVSDCQPDAAQKLTDRLFQLPARMTLIPERRNSRIELQRTKDNTVVFERVRVQIRKALNEWKSVKQDRDLTSSKQFSISIARADEKLEKSCAALKEFKEEQLILLEKQIETTIDSIRMTGVYSTGQNADFNVNFHLPAVVYTRPATEKRHTYSYEFSTAPRIRVLNPPAPTDCPNMKKKREKPEPVNDEDDFQQDEQPAPVAPAQPPVRSRSVFVIKI